MFLATAVTTWRRPQWRSDDDEISSRRRLIVVARQPEGRNRCSGLRTGRMDRDRCAISRSGVSNRWSHGDSEWCSGM